MGQTNGVHKDFGKIPKYLANYKKEAEEKQQKKAEMEAKKKMPPGTKQISEDERIKTLEELV